ncbi:MAG TPA: FtsX-like permease family protein, partial [Rubricoccaceae bacterium]
AARHDVLKRALASVPGVRRTSLATGVPGDYGMIMALSPEDTGADPADDVQTQFAQVDAEYAAALGLQMAAGTWIRPEAAARENEAGIALGGDVVLNETAARRLGLMTTGAEAAVGRRLDQFEVVGVVRDFHFAGLRTEIAPFAFMPLAERVPKYQLVLQLDGGDVGATLDAAEAVWAGVVPAYPFEARFVDDRFAEQMRADRQLGQLFGAVSGVAVLLACLGMFGLAAHAAERRTKEIGVRKVLGASVGGLVALLSGEFVRLVLLALVVAAPVAAVLAQRWLEGFAYPAPLHAAPFVAIGLGVLALALLTVSVHAVRAATADPVKALRSE